MHDFDMGISRDVLREQRHVAFDLLTAFIGAPDTDRYRLVAREVVEGIVRHSAESAAATDEEMRRLTAALVEPAALLITTALVATCLAEAAAEQTGVGADELISRAVARVATLPTTAL
jgi:hypothetical protein